MDCSMPGSSVHGILGKSTGVGCHSFPRASSQPRDRTLTSFVSCIGRWILYHYNSFGEHVWDSFWLTEQVQALMSFLFWEQQGARPNLDNLSLYLVLKSPEFTHPFKVFTPVHTWKSAPDGIMPEADACCSRGEGDVFLCVSTMVWQMGKREHSFPGLYWGQMKLCPVLYPCGKPMCLSQVGEVGTESRQADHPEWFETVWQAEWHPSAPHGSIPLYHLQPQSCPAHGREENQADYVHHIQRQSKLEPQLGQIQFPARTW